MAMMEYIGSDGKPTALTESQVGSKNITTKFREAFETYNPNPTGSWIENKASGDLVFVDGNTASASYLVISKSPFTQGTTTSVETTAHFNMPVDLSFGAHKSQFTLGQEFAIEFVSTETANPVPDLTIASISQATTTLTVTTTTPHGLVPGKRIGISGVPDSRLDYPALVVATIPSPTQFTCTAGPAGNLPSVTAGPFTTGTVFFRSALGFASDGTAMVLENTSATNASFYLRSNSGDALPSGTIAGNHSVTVNTLASVQAVNTAYSYSFLPTTEYKLVAMADRFQWTDAPVDTVAAATNRTTRSQVIPDPSKDYKFRVRATNNKSLTVPFATIVSVTKSGTTTATVVFDRPHNLTTADQIVAYGVRDQTNFANLVAATAVASVVNPTTITVVWGAAVTATSFGGYAAVVNGGNLMSSLGAINVAVQSATLTNGILTLVANTNWSGLVIGDTCEVFGVRNGVVPGVDGTYRVRNFVTTSLELERISGTNPADFVTTNFGGAVIKRTDLRLSFVRIFDFERQRVEMLPRPGGDQASAFPVTIQNAPSVSITGNPVLGAGANAIGTVSLNAAIPAGTNAIGTVSLNAALPTGTNVIGTTNIQRVPVTLIADVASAAITTTTTTAAFTPTWGTSYQINIPVTAVTGTTPTMNVRIEESDDNGTNWFTVYDFPRITATGIYRSPVMPLGTGTRVRYVQTLGGTSPSFTRAINRLQSNVQTTPTRQLVDRAIAPNTLNSVTGTLLAHDAGNSTQLVVNMGAITTTAPQFQLEGSDDFGLTWYAIGTPLTAVASSTVQVTVNSINAGAVRARVSTAGVGATLGYVMIKAHD